MHNYSEHYIAHSGHYPLHGHNVRVEYGIRTRICKDFVFTELEKSRLIPGIEPGTSDL